MGRALRPSTPGDFPVAGKVTKGAPRAMPFGIPRCVVAALFALAALRSVSRRATFYYKPRPICHFKLVGKSVFFLPKLHRGSHPLLSIRGSAGMPSRMPQVLYSRNQYRYGRRRGNPRGSAPLCRRSRNQEVPGVSLPTFSTRESRPGCGAERPLSEGVGAVLPHWGAQRGASPSLFSP